MVTHCLLCVPLQPTKEKWFGVKVAQLHALSGLQPRRHILHHLSLTVAGGLEHGEMVVLMEAEGTLPIGWMDSGGDNDEEAAAYLEKE